MERPKRVTLIIDTYASKYEGKYIKSKNLMNDINPCIKRSGNDNDC